MHFGQRPFAGNTQGFCITLHAFISHDPEDGRAADWLQHTLEAAGIRVWRDAADLLPGQDRRSEIRKAISEGALVFIACFSRFSLARPRSIQNEELLLAVEQLLGDGHPRRPHG
jgi:hypothetical protein